MLIIGTAGHIDHGKSSIVKRLTGTDPDRLPEEKARGMTIDLGFAFYTTPSGDTIAFVDVPGHERFVKNMIAGAGGIDVVMLVIAADDGWMPQSEEHFQVVRLLGVEHGLIVINKTDLAENDWIELLEQDISEKIDGSFLSQAPIFKVSSQTGEGFDTLTDYLNAITDTIAARRDIGKPRLFIDRSFIRPGIGGVVTGTLRGGDFLIGQNVAVWPSQRTGKIRSLQSNGKDVQTALPGQRTAVSLTGVDKEFLMRGGVITSRSDLSYFEHNPVLALSIELLKNSPVKLVDRRRVILIVGTTEVEGEIRLYDRRELAPSEQGIVFFKPDDPIYCLIGDPYIIRLPTPMVTLGGGQVVDHLEHFPRRRYLGTYDYLRQRLDGTLQQLIVSELGKRILAVKKTFLENAAYSDKEIYDNVTGLIKEGQITLFKNMLYISRRLEEAVEQFRLEIAGYLEGKSHLKGLQRDQLTQLSPYDPSVTETLIQVMESDGQLIKLKDSYNLAGRGMTLKGEVKSAYNNIMTMLKEQPFAPPAVKELTAGGKAFREAVKFILDSERGHKCGSNLIFLQESWDDIIRFIRKHLSHSDSLAVPDLREAFGFTRKFAIPILEETDRIQLTQREGDVRVKGSRFENEESIP